MQTVTCRCQDASTTHVSLVYLSGLLASTLCNGSSSYANRVLCISWDNRTDGQSEKKRFFVYNLKTKEKQHIDYTTFNRIYFAIVSNNNVYTTSGVTRIVCISLDTGIAQETNIWKPIQILTMLENQNLICTLGDSIAVLQGSEIQTLLTLPDFRVCSAVQLKDGSLVITTGRTVHLYDHQLQPMFHFLGGFEGNYVNLLEIKPKFLLAITALGKFEFIDITRKRATSLPCYQKFKLSGTPRSSVMLSNGNIAIGWRTGFLSGDITILSPQGEMILLIPNASKSVVFAEVEKNVLGSIKDGLYLTWCVKTGRKLSEEPIDAVDAICFMK